MGFKLQPWPSPQKIVWRFPHHPVFSVSSWSDRFFAFCLALISLTAACKEKGGRVKEGHVERGREKGFSFHFVSANPSPTPDDIESRPQAPVWQSRSSPGNRTPERCAEKMFFGFVCFVSCFVFNLPLIKSNMNIQNLIELYDPYCGEP